VPYLTWHLFTLDRFIWRRPRVSDGALSSLAQFSRHSTIILLIIGGWRILLGCTLSWLVEHHYGGGYGVSYCSLLTTLALLPREHFTWRLFYWLWLVEVVTWHSFMGAPPLGSLSSLLHGYFNYTWKHLISIGQHPHRSVLAHILFYFEVVMEEFYWGVWHIKRTSVPLHASCMHLDLEGHT